MNYLELANKVLQEMNEPEISAASGIAAARGVQKQVLSAINKSYRYIIGKEREWPFNYQDGSFATVDGTDLYDKETNTKVIDWDSFYIGTTGSDDVTPRRIRMLSRAAYRNWYKRDDIINTTDTRGIPRFVYRDKSNKIGLTPVPDDVYQIEYQYWTQPTELVAATDEPLIPEHYQWIIVEGAMMFASRMRSDLETARMAENELETGIKLMREELIGGKKDMTSYRAVPTATKYSRWSY